MNLHLNRPSQNYKTEDNTSYGRRGHLPYEQNPTTFTKAISTGLSKQSLY